MKKSDKLAREVLEQHHEQAYKWAMSCCEYDSDKAKEIMQAVYVEILNNKAMFRGKSSLRTWLFGVISRTARRQRRLLGSAERLRLALTGLLEAGNDTGDCSVIELEKLQLTKAVMDALAELSPKQRQVIELVYYRDFTLVEAAEILGMRLGSVRTHFHRAKQALARRLQPIREYRN